ncbi:MAG: hypothetical protein JRN23_03530 [Nitrososphaerota archaeon]|jgi:hypothetical protein|nr:hypothetical protein [Nitrososphaerota archaeon]MDG6966518.1 hypothetical protein [Nitrososphaerota archaeon]MDG6978623.1 hypothetical protein [Nitrososphaerota archaeon]MDG7020985.1 hypothetical protein [Nitrososphaerota archaeon]
MPKLQSGLAVVFAALLVISATAGAYYYQEYRQASQTGGVYAGELTTATSRYASLAAGYNSSLALDNATLSLLAGTVSAINTSLPIYGQASVQLSQLWASYLRLEPASSSLYSSNILIDFGNGTQVWHNGTRVQPGWNMYTETVVLTQGRLQAVWYPAYGEHLISGIDGVQNSATMSWFLWTFAPSSSWQTAQVGADELPVYNGSVFAWTYCAVSPSFTPECTP